MSGPLQRRKEAWLRRRLKCCNYRRYAFSGVPGCRVLGEGRYETGTLCWNTTSCKDTSSKSDRDETAGHMGLMGTDIPLQAFGPWP